VVQRLQQSKSPDNGSQPLSLTDDRFIIQVDVTLSTHDVGGLSELDVQLAEIMDASYSSLTKA
jgi:pterin-4a-carbinolamine dehydratase